jgi:hypothetical protein
MKKIILMLSLVIACGGSFAGPLNLFETGSRDEILASQKGQAFALLVWSLDCRPCHGKLAELGKLRAQYPDWQLVLLSVDGPERAAEVGERLAEFDLGDEDNWLFGDAPAAQLRHRLDPGWYGELPRTYLFDRDHGVVGLSGSLPLERLEAHFDAAAVSANQQR